VDHFILTKLVFEGGHDSVRIDMALTIDSSDPKLAVTRSIQSAIGRATAAEFDDNLLPGTADTYDIGQSSSEWRNAAFSGSVGIGISTPQTELHVQHAGASLGGLRVSSDQNDKYIVVGGDWPYIDSYGTGSRLLINYNSSQDIDIGNSDLYIANSSGQVGVGTSSTNEVLTVNGNLSLAEGSAPSNTSSFGKLYVSSSDSLLHFIDDGGTSHPFFTDSKCLWLEDPTGADDLDSIWQANGFGATITQVWCESDQTTTIDFKIGGNDVIGPNLSCTSGGVEDNTLTGGDQTLADGDALDFVISGVSGSPTWVSACWTFIYTE